MLTVASTDRAALVPGLRHNGMRSYSGDRRRYWIPAMSNVDFDIDGLWPYNFCLGEVQCALGTRMLERLDAINAERAERARRFIDGFAGYPELAFQRVPRAAAIRGTCWPRAMTELIRTHRVMIFSKTLASSGVEAVVQYCPLYRYPMFQRAGFGRAECPQTDRFFDNMVSFPFQQWMPPAQFDLMIVW